MPLVKRLWRPAVGTLRTQSTSLWSADRPGLRMITKTPPNTATHRTLRRLVGDREDTGPGGSRQST